MSLTLTETFVVTLLATVAGGIVLGILTVLWRNRSKPQEWIAGQAEAAAQAEAVDAADQLIVLREQVLEVARERHLRLPVSATGRNPTAVDYSDGGTFWFFSDLPAYKRACAAGTADPRRASWNAHPPDPVSQWSRERLETWLVEHLGEGSSPSE